jgi:hypothetical protein
MLHDGQNVAAFTSHDAVVLGGGHVAILQAGVY